MIWTIATNIFIIGYLSIAVLWDLPFQNALLAKFRNRIKPFLARCGLTHGWGVYCPVGDIGRNLEVRLSLGTGQQLVWPHPVPKKDIFLIQRISNNEILSEPYLDYVIERLPEEMRRQIAIASLVQINHPREMPPKIFWGSFSHNEHISPQEKIVAQRTLVHINQRSLTA